MVVAMQIPGGPNALRLADVRKLVHAHTGIHPDRQVLVSNGRLLHGGGREVVAEEEQGIEVETYVRPAAGENISVRTTFRREALDSSYPGNAPVSDLKRFLARRYRLAPCRQVLTTLGITMEEQDPLGAYAAHDPIVVAVAIGDVVEEWPPLPLSMQVYHRDGMGHTTFKVDAHDTFDVLAGIVERAGLVTQAEDVTFYSDLKVFLSWRTFADYALPSPTTLWMWID